MLDVQSSESKTSLLESTGKPQNHESSAASPVLDKSYTGTISKHEVTFDMVPPRKLEKVENDLQNIEEESKFHTSFDNSLSLISLNNSQAEERSMVTAVIIGFDSVFESLSIVRVRLHNAMERDIKANVLF